MDHWGCSPSLFPLQPFLAICLKPLKAVCSCFSSAYLARGEGEGGEDDNNKGTELCVRVGKIDLGPVGLGNALGVSPLGRGGCVQLYYT